MACNLDSRLGQLEEQGKTMVDATRRLLETVNVVNDTGELLLQMIENHQTSKDVGDESKGRKFD